MHKLTLVSLALCLIGALAAGQEGLDLLLALDRARFLDVPVSQLTAIVRSESGDTVEEAELVLSFKEIEGENYVRIEFLRPADLAGQVFLVTPQGTYFWQPELFAPIRTSGAQAAFGDAAIGQLSGIRFAPDYRIGSRRELRGADGAALLELELRALSPAVPFQTVVVTAEASSLRPRELRLLAPTGVPLYRVLLTKYAELEGDLYVRDQVVENALVEGNRTLLSIVAVSLAPVPDEAFDPSRLGR